MLTFRVRRSPPETFCVLESPLFERADTFRTRLMVPPPESWAPAEGGGDGEDSVSSKFAARGVTVVSVSSGISGQCGLSVSWLDEGGNGSFSSSLRFGGRTCRLDRTRGLRATGMASAAESDVSSRLTLTRGGVRLRMSFAGDSPASRDTGGSVRLTPTLSDPPVIGALLVDTGVSRGGEEAVGDVSESK